MSCLVSRLPSRTRRWYNSAAYQRRSRNWAIRLVRTVANVYPPHKSPTSLRLSRAQQMVLQTSSLQPLSCAVTCVWRPPRSPLLRSVARYLQLLREMEVRGRELSGCPSLEARGRATKDQVSDEP